MDTFEIIKLIVLGIILGVVGQGARAVMGMKKSYDKLSKDWFDVKLLITSLMIGGIAGAIGAVTISDRKVIDRQTLLTLITIGYAGTDFIESFIKMALPDQDQKRESI